MSARPSGCTFCILTGKRAGVVARSAHSNTTSAEWPRGMAALPPSDITTQRTRHQANQLTSPINTEVCRCFEYRICSDATPRRRLERVRMPRPLLNEHCVPPVNTFRTSERKSEESADFGSRIAAPTRLPRPPLSLVSPVTHPSVRHSCTNR